MAMAVNALTLSGKAAPAEWRAGATG